MGLRAIVFAMFACGCVGSQLEPVPPPVAFAPPGDTFWLQEAREVATRPPPAPVRSISLGYIGDNPLSGGVMRDTPMQPFPAPEYVQSTPNPPCSCALRSSRYEFEEPTE